MKGSDDSGVIPMNKISPYYLYVGVALVVLYTIFLAVR